MFINDKIISHGIFADMTIDYAFKRVFGTERYKAATIGMLNSIIKDRKIEDVEFIANEIPRETDDGKTSIIDVMCREADGTRFVVEMQRGEQKNFQQRTLYYMSKIISLYDLKSGDDSYNFPCSYMVSFLNFPIEQLYGNPSTNGKCYLHYTTQEQHSKDKFPSSPEFYFLDLTKAPHDIRNILNEEEFWVYLLRESKSLKDIPAQLKGQPSFDAFFNGATLSGYSKDEKLAYEKDMLLKLDIENSKREAEQKAYAKGKGEGLAEGEAKGKAEGLAEAQLEIARKMKAMALSAEQIAAATGLSVDEIRKL